MMTRSTSTPNIPMRRKQSALLVMYNSPYRFLYAQPTIDLISPTTAGPNGLIPSNMKEFESEVFVGGVAEGLNELEVGAQQKLSLKESILRSTKARVSDDMTARLSLS